MSVVWRISLLLALLRAAGPARGFTQFLDEVPNALGVPGTTAVGHTNPDGGGLLNAFGKDFLAHELKWTRALCEKDSDGDGETNGLELGDPCCRWKRGILADRPARGWELSHPGDSSSTTGLEPPSNCTAAHTEWAHTAVASSDTQFWRFYFGRVPRVPKTESRSTVGRLVFWRRLDGPRAPPLKDAALPKVTRTSSTLALCTVAVAYFTYGTWKEVRSSGWKRHAGFALLALFYVDFLSALAHITLDNPFFCAWPILGSGAVAFQSHHRFPTDITEMTAFTYLQSAHLGQVLLASTFVFRRQSGPLRVFLCWAVVWFTVAMMSHRWAHYPSATEPLLLRAAQLLGVFLSVERHAVHHTHFDANFSLIGGWADLVVNPLSRWLIDPTNPLWVFFLLGWGLLPAVVSSPTIHVSLQRKLREGLKSALDQLSRHEKSRDGEV
jgi:Lipid desaturase domain